MKPIELDTMLTYHYLSGLNTYQDKLIYIDTLADMDHNDYTQRLHHLDPITKEEHILLEDKRVNYAIVDDALMILKRSSEGFYETNVFRYDHGLIEEGSFPLLIQEMHGYTDLFYFVTATGFVDCPDYHLLDENAKKAYHAQKEANADYLVLDEYPFFYNGAGFINGTRNNGFLINKNDHSITRITPCTMDVEQVLIDGEKIFLLANDYRSMKKMWSSIYQYDLLSKELSCLYKNESLFISKIVLIKGKLHALASEKTCISGKSFYEVAEGQLKCVYKSEWMFDNSIGSDCRYGQCKNSLTVHGDLYILNTVDERSVLHRFDGKELTYMTNFEGSVDDFTFLDDRLYIIAMKDMRLQEIYQVEKDAILPLTHINEEVLKDRYVAKPEKISCFNLHEIRGWVLKPIDFDPDKKYPMILDIHGGPKTAYGEVFYHEMQLWASKGYFVIFCNPHCSDGRGDAFADYRKHYGATDYEDLMQFVDRALAVYPQIDPDRLCVTGGSYGGYMTNWIITHTDRFKAAVSQRSISNRVADFYYSDYSYDTTYENGIDLNGETIELFWDRSPLKYAENAITPTLFLQSTEDYRCPFPEAIQLFSALKWKGVETKIIGFIGENHELSRSGKPAHRLKRLEEITNWMETHVK